MLKNARNGEPSGGGAFNRRGRTSTGWKSRGRAQRHRSQSARRSQVFRGRGVERGRRRNLPLAERTEEAGQPRGGRKATEQDEEPGGCTVQRATGREKFMETVVKIGTRFHSCRLLVISERSISGDGGPSTERRGRGRRAGEKSGARSSLEKW